jgi:pimeloyl-ACP methyl ester carboxylesterase
VGNSAGNRRSEEPDLSVRHRRIHGHDLAYRIAGRGPALLLLHALSSTSGAWQGVMPALAKRHTVIAPDLPGHGASEGPASDYSTGGLADAVRDLLLTLGHERVTVVGHSLGGGVAMQFAYKYPERCERMVLVSAGGLGKEVAGFLRVFAVPGVDRVVGLFLDARFQPTVMKAASLLKRARVPLPKSAEAWWDSYASLTQPEARRAFFRILRAGINVNGQRESATDRLYLAAAMPTLIIWGERDGIIPVSHGRAAHEAIPGSILEVFEGAGHFPHHDDPDRFVRTVLDFVASTPPARLTRTRLRELVREHDTA